MNIVSVDPGSKCSGLVVIRSYQIHRSFDKIDNEQVYNVIKDEVSRLDETMILVEDIKPYSLKLRQDVIDTCKFIGVICWQMEALRFPYTLISRWQIKKWVYDTFPEAVRRVDQYIVNKKIVNKTTGEPRSSSFVFVDDRIVIAVMKEMWGIETPKPGKTNRYGITGDAWQALALASFHLKSQTCASGTSLLK